MPVPWGNSSVRFSRSFMQPCHYTGPAYRSGLSCWVGILAAARHRISLAHLLLFVCLAFTYFQGTRAALHHGTWRTLMTRVGCSPLPTFFCLFSWNWMVIEAMVGVWRFPPELRSYSWWIVYRNRMAMPLGGLDDSCHVKNSRTEGLPAREPQSLARWSRIHRQADAHLVRLSASAKSCSRCVPSPWGSVLFSRCGTTRCPLSAFSRMFPSIHLPSHRAAAGNWLPTLRPASRHHSPGLLQLNSRRSGKAGT